MNLKRNLLCGVVVLCCIGIMAQQPTPILSGKKELTDRDGNKTSLPYLDPTLPVEERVVVYHDA